MANQQWVKQRQQEEQQDGRSQGLASKTYPKGVILFGCLSNSRIQNKQVLFNIDINSDLNFPSSRFGPSRRQIKAINVIVRQHFSNAFGLKDETF